MDKVTINGNVLTEEHMWGTNKSAMTKERYRVINAALPLLEKLKWD